MPFFSIVTPVFNRQREVRRAIESCLAQDFTDLEQIVVDDGSSDRTADVVASYSDDRVRLIRHEQNRGVCPARNTAIRASTGDWVIFLDSDHELVPGCLTRIYEIISGEPEETGRIGFLYKLDDGRISPSVLPPPRRLDYEDWLRFVESTRLSDALWATRRSTFEQCMMPESFALEFKYNLDFSKIFTWRIVPEALAFQYTDAPGRITSIVPSADESKELQRARDCLEDWNAVMREHGGALQVFAPKNYQGALRGRAISHLLAGSRWRAIRASFGCILRYPGNIINWAVLASTVAGRRTMRLARRYRVRNARAGVRLKEVMQWAHQR